MNNAANNGVQGTRHKVSGPLTPDVGAMKMKSWLTLMAVVLGVGCVSHPHASDNTSRQSPYGYEMRFWQVMTTNNVRTQFGDTPDVSKELADIIIMKAAKDLTPVNISIHLCHGVAVSNTYWLQEMAEKYGVTNITVKINQPQPPSYRSENEKLQQGVPPLRRTKCAEGER